MGLDFGRYVMAMVILKCRYYILNIKKKKNNNSKQDEEQNQTCRIYNEDGEPSDKSSNNICNNSFEKQPVTELPS